MKAYLQFGGAACGLPNGPFQTVSVECKETTAPRSGMTQTGYGAKLPTPYMVKWEGKWRRVLWQRRVALHRQAGRVAGNG